MPFSNFRVSGLRAAVGRTQLCLKLLQRLKPSKTALLPLSHDAFIEHNRSMNSSGWGLQTFKRSGSDSERRRCFFFVTLPDVDPYSASNRRRW
jgi:hypothetical protein